MLFSLSTLFFLGLSAAAYGDELDRVVELMRLPEMAQEQHRQCIAGAKAVFVNEMSFEYQTNRYGLTTDDPGWEELTSIYAEFYASSCRLMEPKKTLQVVKEVYRERFRGRELHDLSRFLSSSVGQRLLDADVEVNRIILQQWADEVARDTETAQRRFESRLDGFLREQEKAAERGTLRNES